jgi:hypothetical protein
LDNISEASSNHLAAKLGEGGDRASWVAPWRQRMPGNWVWNSQVGHLAAKLGEGKMELAG